MGFGTSQMGAIGEGTAGLIAMHVGFRNARKAREEAARLAKERPQYQITPESQYEEGLTQNELATGMSSQAKAAYDNSAGNSIASSLDAMLKTGSSGSNIADLFSADAQGRQQLALMKDQIRMNQIGNVINSWRNMSEQKDKQWQINEDAPWKDAAQANADARKAAAALQMEGFKTFVKSQSTFAGAKNDTQTYSDYWKNGSGTTQQAPAFNLNNSSGNSAMPVQGTNNNISGQTTNSDWMNSIGGGSQGWYSGR